MKKYMLLLVFCLGLFAQNQKMQIFKPITSECPKEWLEQMENEIGQVEIVSLMSVKNLKREIGVPKEVQSCNTSIIDDYVFEGNVPLKAIKEYFKNIPKDSIGLSLPAYENNKEIKTVFVIFSDNTYKEFGKY